MAHDIFISYSTKDKPTADAICASLEANGIRCWIAPRDILPGSDWGEAIIDAIHACRVMVLVFSGNSNASPQIKREIERSVNAGIPVVPFRIEDVLPSKTLEYFISTQHWLDALTPPLEQHLQYLATTMRAMLVQKVDGSEAEVREPQLKPQPAATAATPPAAAAPEPPAIPPPAAATAPVPPPAAAAAPAPAAGDSGRKFASPVVIGILVLAVAVATLAGVLWRRGDRPTTPPVAVKAPEKPLIADKAPDPTEPEDRAKAAVKSPTGEGQGPVILPPTPPQKETKGPKQELVPSQPPLPAPDPLSRFQVGRQWAIDWQSLFKYRGVMQIRQQLGANRYLARITVSFLSNKDKEITVSMDGLLTIRGKDVVINCSNASESWWDTDDFYLEWNNDTMTGYNIDKKGRRGNAVFRFVGGSDGASREQPLQENWAGSNVKASPPTVDSSSSHTQKVPPIQEKPVKSVPEGFTKMLPEPVKIRFTKAKDDVISDSVTSLEWYVGPDRDTTGVCGAFPKMMVSSFTFEKLDRA